MLRVTRRFGISKRPAIHGWYLGETSKHGVWFGIHTYNRIISHSSIIIYNYNIYIYLSAHISHIVLKPDLRGPANIYLPHLSPNMASNLQECVGLILNYRCCGVDHDKQDRQLQVHLWDHDSQFTRPASASCAMMCYAPMSGWLSDTSFLVTLTVLCGLLRWFCCPQNCSNPEA